MAKNKLDKMKNLCYKYNSKWLGSVFFIALIFGQGFMTDQKLIASQSHLLPCPFYLLTDGELDMELKNCLFCGKSFYIKPYLGKLGYGKFCSRECMGRWKSKNIRGKNHPNWKGGLIKRKCLNCGKIFIEKTRRERISGHYFCSSLCSSIFFGKGRRNRIKKNCLNCEVSFETLPCYVKGGHGKFCSSRCFGLYNIGKAKRKDTSIELKVEKELKRRNIRYFKQIILEKIACVDFYLPNNKIIIQCDGEYFHELPKVKNRDFNQDFILSFRGYKIFRFWGHEINQSAKKCIDKIFG